MSAPSALPRPGTCLLALAAAPLRRVPAALHGRLAAALLNRLLARPLREGELAALEGRSLGLRLDDAGLALSLTLTGGRLAAGREAADATISGDLATFLLLLGREEDPDTLFFQQRLAIEGDTALGLAVKNFLDGLDWDALPLPAAAQRGLRWVARRAG